MLPKHFLVPTDLTDGAEAALAYACELAGQLGATVHLVNVIGVPTLGVPEVGGAATSTMIDQIVKENQAALERLADKHRGTATIGKLVLKIGDAKDAIEEAAKELGADLIIMSTHGRTGVSRFLLGSIAEKVVRSAPCPVLTIRAHDKDEDSEKAA